MESLEGRTLFSAMGLNSGKEPASISIALIDQTLPDQALLSQSMTNATRIYFNPKTEPAAAVLNAALQATDQLHAKISSLMVFSHGNAGYFSLGDELVSARNIGNTSSQWRDLARHFTDNATIDLFACDLAASPMGRQLLDKLHDLTGADVYGSTNLTGRGGDWILEAHSQHAASNPQLPLNTEMLASYPDDLLITTTVAAAATPATVTGTTTVLSVTMLDTLGTPTFAWTTTSKPSGSTVTFSNNNTTTASITTATFNKAGSYSFTVTGTDGSASSSSSVNVTVNQTLTSISVTPGTASLALNATQSFSASALDQFGNAMTSQPSFTWSRTGVGSIGSSGLFSSASSIGTSIVTATSGLISGTATVTVANATPTLATAAAATTSNVTTSSVALSVLGADDGGESNLIYTWAATTKPAGSAPVFSSNGLNASKATTVTFYVAGSYTFQATITDLFGASVTSSVSVTVSQTLSTLIVSPSSPTLHLNQTEAFTDSALDQFGNAMSSAPTIAWSLGGSSVGSINAATGSYNSGATPGTATIDATASGVTGTDTVSVANATPTIATAATATPSTVTGTTAALSVLGADDGGESNLTYTWSTATKPTGAASPIFSINGTNAAKNCTATFSQQGAYILQVTVSDAFGASCTSSVAVTVTLGNPNVTVTAGTTALNLNQTQLFTATAYDQFGNPLTVQPVFTWSLGAGSVGTINAVTGIYNSGSNPGSATVIATSGSYSSSAAVSVTNAAPTVAVPAACTPGTVTGTTGSLSVLGADDGGEPNLTYTWSATTKPTGATPTFSANGTNAAKASTITFNKAGNYVLSVSISDGSLSTTSTVSVTVSQTTTSIAVTPSTASLNENQTQQFSAVAYDQFGIAMTPQPTLTWATGLGSVGSVSSAGLYTAPGLAGSATITVSAGLVIGSATVTITNAAPTVAVAAAASPSTVTGTTTALSVLGADDGGESNLIYTWSATTKPTGSTVLFNANGVNSAKNVTATFNTAGNYVLTAVIFDGTYSVSSSVAVTVSQTVSSIVVSPSVATLHENATQQFTAEAYDQFGTALATQPAFAWSKVSGVGSINSSGLFSTTTSIGASVVQASSGGVNALAAVTVINASPTIATAASALQSLITGTSTTVSVLGADDGGEANLTYTWAATVAPTGATASFSINGTNAAKTSVVTFSKAGAYQLTATISDGTSTVSSTVAVTVVSTATTLTLTPATVSLAENATQLFTAVAYDQFGIVVVPQPALTWSKTSGVGTVSALGTYTAPNAAGSAVVSVTGGGLWATAAVTVINYPPTIVTPATASPSTVTGNSTVLTVLATDDGGAANLTYTWAASTAPSGGTVTFSANGTNAAQLSTAAFSKAGSYTLTATISDGTNAITSAVTVAVSQTLSTITVTPATSSLHLNQSEQLTAVAYDQFGNLMSPQPTLLWTVVGGGSVTQAGMYTSAGSPNSGIVYASSGLVSGSASITVTNATPTVATAAAANPVSVTGTTAALSVLGADDGGEANLSYTWSATSPAGATPVFSLNGTNAAKNTTVTFNAIGNYTFTATITDAYGASVTSSVAVTVGQTLTAITVSPASKTLSIGSTCQFTTAAWDQFGNAMTTQPVFTWAVTSGGGSVSSSGLFTAGGSAGTSVVTASSGAVSGSATITTVNSLAITATVNPSTGTSASLAVLGLSGTATLAWSVTSQPAGASASFDSTISSTPTLSFSAAGTYTVGLSVTVASVTTTLSDTFTVSQTLTSITVTPATASVDENQTIAIAAVGFDQFGVPMLTQPTFSWTVASGVGSVNASGVYTSGGSAGTASVRATSGSVYGSSTITTINAPPTITVPATASPALVTGTSTALSVSAADDGGEPLLQYTWVVSSSPANSAVAFSVNGNNAAKNTVATFNHAGAYIFTVTVSDGTNTVSSTTVATVVQTVTSMGITAAASTVNETASDQLTATAYDQFGNQITAQTAVTWSESDGLGTVNSAGQFVAGTATGTAEVRASVGAVFADQLISITQGAPTVAIAAAASSPAITGTSSILTVLGSDENGESTLTYTWSITSAPTGGAASFSVNGNNAAKVTTATFNQAGNYTFTATISNGQSSVTSSVSVAVPQILTTITVAPTSASMNLQQSQQFSALGFDQFGNAMSPAPTFDWTISSGVGSVNASGLYSSGSEGGFAHVRASADGVYGAATVTVTDAAPTIVNPASASPALVTGISTQLSVLANDDNGESNLTYTWAVTSQPSGANPAYSVNDSNAAKNTTVFFNEAGSYSFAVSISDGTNTIVSTVAVTVVQTMSSISVIPPSADLPVQNALQMAAIAQDQFGTPLAQQPSFNWTLPSGTGSVSSSGLYVAGSSDGIATVQAQADDISAVSTMTVYGAPPLVTSAATASPSPVTGTYTDLSVTASTTSNDALDFTWAMTSGPAGAAPVITQEPGSAPGTYTSQAHVVFNLPGDYQFTVTVSDGVESTTSAVWVSVQSTLTSLAVTPQSAVIGQNSSQQMTVTGYDQFGEQVAIPSVNWSIWSGSGSITADGQFLSTSAVGTVEIVAISGTLSASAPVVVVQNPLALSQPATADESVVTGTSVGLHVSATGGSSELTYDWTQVSGPMGAITSFSANQSDAAGDTVVTFDLQGDYVFQATATDSSGQSVQSSVAVTVVQTATSLAVTVPQSTTTGGGTIQAFAQGANQFGRDMSVPLIWSVDSGSVGTVNSTGLFTAPNANGTSTLRATSGDITGTCIITSAASATTIAVTASSSQNYTHSSTGVLSATITGDNSPSVVYTWSIVSQPTAPKPKLPTEGAEQAWQGMAIFGINGTAQAANTPVTYRLPGSYVFKVTATDGSLTASNQIQVTIEKGAVNTNLTVVSGVKPMVTDGLLSGYAITFSRALDPTTANNLLDYRVIQNIQQPTGRTFIDHLFGTNKGTRTVSINRQIASVTYNPATFSVTLELVKPLALVDCEIQLQVTGSGEYGIKDVNGLLLDGNNDGKPGGLFIYAARLHVGTYTQTYADGSVGTIKLFGPGTLLLVGLGDLPPLIYLHGCDPGSSVIVGTVVNRPRKFKPKVIRAVIGSQTASVYLGSGYVIPG
jgi:hypothetical protein